MRQMLSCLALLATTSCGNPPDPMVPGPVTLSGSRVPATGSVRGN